MGIKRSIVSYYPVALNLKDKLVVVIGGGRVSEHKIKNLLLAQAKIKLISPFITRGLKRLVSERKLTWVPRPARSADLRFAGLVIAATSSPVVNKSVSEWGRKHGVWVNVVDEQSLSDFISPAIFRASKAVVAVHTNGRDPVFSRDLKNFLKENWNVFLSYRNRL